MIVNEVFNNFASGELSPNVWARNDRPFYKSGLEIARNVIPLLTGGKKFRPGTEYSIHTRLNQVPALWSFRFNVSQSYDLEFTDQKMRVHMNGGVVLETAKNVTGITKANPGVVTVSTHGFSTGDEVYFSGIGGMTGLNGQFFLVVKIDANTFSLTDIDGAAINTTSWDAFTSGGTVARIYEISTPYVTADLDKIRISGVADLAYITCLGYEPRKLIRSGHASWSLATYHRTVMAKAITGITQASPGVVTCTAHGFITGDRILIRGVAGMEELNENIYLVVKIGDDSFSLTTVAAAAVNTTGYAAYSTGGFAAKILSAAHVAITGITKANPGVVTSANHGLVTGDKCHISGVTGMVEVNEQYYWVEKVDANSFKLLDEFGDNVNTSGFTTYTSDGVVAKVTEKFVNHGDFPATSGFFGGRNFMGGSENDPDVFDGSRGPDANTGASRFDDFTVGTADTDAVSYTLASQHNTADQIFWFSGTPGFLVIGTSGGVYKANGGSDGAAITPSAINVVPVSSIGVQNTAPTIVGNQTLYVEQGGLTLRSFGYDLVEDEYKAFDKSIIADEITVGGITKLAFSKGRPEIVWSIRADGVLLSCTLLEKDDVAGWARQYIGGNGEVIDISTSPQTTGFDRILVCVERTIDSHTRRYLEYLSEDPIIPDFSDFYTDEDSKEDDEEKYAGYVFELQKQFVRLDSALILDMTQSIALTLSALTGEGITVTAASSLFAESDIGRYIWIKYLEGNETGIAEIVGYTSATEVTVDIKQDFLSLSVPADGWYLTTTSVSGLGHLEGESVGILTDGGVHPDETVSDGTIELDYPARYIIVGERYIGLSRLTAMDFSVAAGVSQGRMKNINKMFFRLKDTVGGKYGDLYDLKDLLFRRAGSSYWDRPPLLFSGLKSATYLDKWANEKRLCIVQDQPLPMTVLAVIPSIDIGEEE